MGAALHETRGEGAGAAYRGLLPEDLIEILTVNRMHYDSRSEKGVLFHMIGALSQFGKVGLTAERQRRFRTLLTTQVYPSQVAAWAAREASPAPA